MQTPWKTVAPRLGVPCVVQRVDVPQRDGTFSDAAARTVRYAALLQMAREHGCSHLATGHTASDNLETIVLNFLRGATVEGFGGIKPHTSLAEDCACASAVASDTRASSRASPQRWLDVARTIRPMRVLTMREIACATNCCRSGRARWWQELNALAQQAARSAQLWRDDIAWMNATAREQMKAITVQEQPHLVTLDGVAFRDLPVALQRRVLREAARRVQGNVQDIGSKHIEVARRHIEANGRRAVWQWRKGLSVEWTGAMSGNRIRLWVVGEAVKNTSTTAQNGHDLTSPELLLSDTSRDTRQA
jgi:tRNA(Ile)-lysidine synthase